MKINLEDYDYHLPPELIAQEAFHPRDKCKFLILKGKKIEHKIFSNILDYLEPGDVLVLNETKVNRCKLVGNKETGGKIIITLVKHLGKNLYETRIKGGKLRLGLNLIFKHNKGSIVKQEEDRFYVQFDQALQQKDLELLTPSYIKKKVPDRDYQTIFAKKSGSLAAPTAGLHFTPELLKKIEKKGVKIAKIQLDISFETFLPVRDVEHHKTGKEYFIVDKKSAQIINQAKRLIAVGTTSVKCLESCNWKNHKIQPTKGFSQIFIKPGFKFQAPLTAMITNFHLPKSSLLLLTAAYAGKDRILNAYNEAVKRKYRFFSLGDAMMIFKE